VPFPGAHQSILDAARQGAGQGRFPGAPRCRAASGPRTLVPMTTTPEQSTVGSQPSTPIEHPTPTDPPAGWYSATVPGPYGPQTTWYRVPSAEPSAGAPSHQTPSLQPRNWQSRIRRSANDKMLAGVCGGIAEHTGIDPVYIRLAFVLSLFWGGLGFFAYLAALLLMPKP